MFNKTITWIISGILFILSLFLAFNLFKTAFPILNIDLEMSRSEAFNKSKELSENLLIGPNEYFQVATFGSDDAAQNYIELDAGGSEKFIEIIKNKTYEAFNWKVRHYQENNINEAWFVFTPDGRPYGFSETLSEDLFIDNLEVNRARLLAESESAKKWNVDLSNFVLIEESKDEKPSKRIDHTFVYKRNDQIIGEEGEFRLKLVVSGNKLTGVKHYIKIPETFNRKYEEMRSSNNTIATIANYGLMIFYILGGIICGLFILNREKWLLWKKAIYWAIFISVFQVLSGLNFLPLSWLGYNTAVSTGNFLLQNLIFALISGLIDFILLVLSFVAAESLTRKAFPNHIKFWNLWSLDNAYSKEVAGRTIGGYFLIGLDLLFVVVFYLITSSYFGWWVPTSTLFSPDMIATPFPWLSAVGMSLHAGFWEECLFRAVPLAGAALIGNKYGNRKLWITFAMILQAIIFAGAHANYPSYPPYSRLIELIIPSIFWGFIYLRFGLLPVIISHFGYDVVWFSLPLFTSSSSDLIFDKCMVILLTLIPLIVVFRSKFMGKLFTNIELSEYNKSFTPQIETVEVVEEKNKDVAPLVLHKNYKRGLYIGAIAGIFLMFAVTKQDYSNLNLNIDRNRAIELSEYHLSNNNIFLDENWTCLSSINSGVLGSDDKFIWQEEGEEAYNEILQTYISNVFWNIRYVKFDGDVNDRTEEYSVIINHKGDLSQIRHKLPENLEGISLNEIDARETATLYLKETFNFISSDYKEISAEKSVLPNRDDWTFIFSDMKTYNLKEGDLRIRINISGDKVTNYTKYIHLPEEWERKEKNNTTFLSIIKTVCYFSLVFFVLYAAAVSVARWSKGRFNIKLFKFIFIGLASISLLNIINKIPITISGFSTAKPYLNQLITSFGGAVLFSFIFAFLFAAIIGNSSMKSNMKKSIHIFSYNEIIMILLWTLGFMGYIYNFDTDVPIWISGFSNVNSYFPFLSISLSNLFNYMQSLVILLFIIIFINNITDYGRQKTFMLNLIIFLFFMAIAGNELSSTSEINSILKWVRSSILSGCLFYMIYTYYIKYDLTFVPLYFALITSVELLYKGLTYSYPGLFIGNILSIFLIVFSGFFLRKYLIDVSE